METIDDLMEEMAENQIVAEQARELLALFHQRDAKGNPALTFNSQDGLTATLFRHRVEDLSASIFGTQAPRELVVDAEYH